MAAGLPEQGLVRGIRLNLIGQGIPLAVGALLACVIPLIVRRVRIVAESGNFLLPLTLLLVAGGLTAVTLSLTVPRLVRGIAYGISAPVSSAEAALISRPALPSPLFPAMSRLGFQNRETILAPSERLVRLMVLVMSDIVVGAAFAEPIWRLWLGPEFGIFGLDPGTL